MERVFLYFHLCFPPDSSSWKWLTSRSAMCAHCLVSSFPGLSPLTHVDHQNTSKDHQRCANLNRRTHKVPDAASSLFKLQPSIPSSVRSQTPLTGDLFFHQCRLQQAGQAFPVGGTWEQRHSWARHLHFLSLLATQWKAYRLGLDLYLPLLSSGRFKRKYDSSFYMWTIVRGARSPWEVWSEKIGVTPEIT